MRAPKRFIVLFDEGFGDAHVLPIVCVRKKTIATLIAVLS